LNYGILEMKIEKKLQIKRECYQKHIEKYRAHHRENYRKDPKKYKLKSKIWRLKNPDKIKEQTKKYLEKNKVIIREQNKMATLKWRRKNPEKCLEIQKRYLESKGLLFNFDVRLFKNALYNWSYSIRKKVKNMCQICNRNADISHHIFSKKDYPELSLNLNNGIALCREHHYEVHGWNQTNFHRIEL